VLSRETIHGDTARVADTLEPGATRLFGTGPSGVGGVANRPLTRRTSNVTPNAGSETRRQALARLVLALGSEPNRRSCSGSERRTPRTERRRFSDPEHSVAAAGHAAASIWRGSVLCQRSPRECSYHAFGQRTTAFSCTRVRCAGCASPDIRVCKVSRMPTPDRHVPSSRVRRGIGRR
jgi:hypothetical protein